MPLAIDLADLIEAARLTSLSSTDDRSAAMAPELQTLADFLAAEVSTLAGKENIQKLVAEGVDKLVRQTIANQLQSWSPIGKEIEKAVADALKLQTPLDLPGYGVMVAAVLRQKMDEVLAQVLHERLAAEMETILRVAPAEQKLSAIVEAMKGDEDASDRYGTYCTVIVEASDAISGYKRVYMDPLEPKQGRYGSGIDKLSCEAIFSITGDGEVYSLALDQKDPKNTIVMGRQRGWRKMIFAAYACGTKIIDDQDGSYDTGFGDF